MGIESRFASPVGKGLATRSEHRIHFAERELRIVLGPFLAVMEGKGGKSSIRFDSIRF
jgi:hypothetical protein